MAEKTFSSERINELFELKNKHEDLLIQCIDNPLKAMGMAYLHENEDEEE